jgi:hypothetical protein
MDWLDIIVIVLVVVVVVVLFIANAFWGDPH